MSIIIYVVFFKIKLILKAVLKFSIRVTFSLVESNTYETVFDDGIVKCNYLLILSNAFSDKMSDATTLWQIVIFLNSDIIRSKIDYLL